MVLDQGIHARVKQLRFVRTSRIHWTDAIIIDFSKDFDLVPHKRLLAKIAASRVDMRVVVWVKEFLLRRSQRFRVDGQLSGEVRVTSGMPQGILLGPLLFLAY